MKSINRTAIIIKPKQPFVDWINTTPGKEVFSMKEISKENTVLLIPEINDYDDAHNFIKSCYEEIFEWELFGWVTAEELWPKNRSWKMFNEWFNIEINSEVFDLVDGEIEKEEL